ncbi:MAG TPA: hypothetical protein VGO50_02430 [Pyrinomonadaceae bacterium]|jgi:hypothetical protein|nr:hypothetical protein [Pyrinomonadaceae bacterium]
MLRKIIYVLFAAILITGNSSIMIAQSDTKPKSLQDEVDKSEARAKIAKAKKEELEAKFPIPDADLLKANTEVEGNLIESRIQAYKAMARYQIR